MKTKTILSLSIAAGLIVLGGAISWMVFSGMFSEIDTSGRTSLVNEATEELDTSQDNELPELEPGEETLEERIATADDVIEVAKSACLNIDEGFTKIQCSRDLGAIIQRTNIGEINEAIAICDALETPADVYNCSYGVFGEYFSPQVTPEDWTPDPTRCDAIEDEGHQSNCFTHLPASYLTANPGAYADALAWCQNVDASNRTICASGVGTYAARGLFDDVPVAEAACASDDATLQSACISGLAVVVLEQFPEFDEAQAQCGKLQPENKDTCYAIIGDSAMTE